MSLEWFLHSGQKLLSTSVLSHDLPIVLCAFGSIGTGPHPWRQSKMLSFVCVVGFALFLLCSFVALW